MTTEPKTLDELETATHAVINDWCNACDDGQISARRHMTRTMAGYRQRNWSVGDIFVYNGNTYLVTENEDDYVKTRALDGTNNTDSFRTGDPDMKSVHSIATEESAPIDPEQFASARGEIVAWIIESHPDRSWTWLHLAGLGQYHPMFEHMRMGAGIRTAQGSGWVQSYNVETGAFTASDGQGSTWSQDPDERNDEDDEEGERRTGIGDFGPTQQWDAVGQAERELATAQSRVERATVNVAAMKVRQTAAIMTDLPAEVPE